MPVSSVPSKTKTDTNNSKKNLLHPCIRVFGKCNFSNKCKFANLPRNTCLNFLKTGKCNENLKGKCPFVHSAPAPATVAVAKKNGNDDDDDDEKEEQLPSSSIAAVAIPTSTTSINTNGDDENNIFDISPSLFESASGMIVTSDESHNNNNKNDEIRENSDLPTASQLFFVKNKTPSPSELFTLVAENEKQEQEKNQDHHLDVSHQNAEIQEVMMIMGHENENDDDDDDDWLSHHFGPVFDDDSNNNNNNREMIANIQITNTQNELTKLKKQAGHFHTQLTDLKKKHKKVTAHRNKLQADFTNATTIVQQECDDKLSKQVEARSKLRREVEDLRYQLHIQEQSQKIFQSQVAAQVQVLLQEELAKIAAAEKVAAEEKEKKKKKEHQQEQENNNNNVSPSSSSFAASLVAKNAKYHSKNKNDDDDDEEDFIQQQQNPSTAAAISLYEEKRANEKALQVKIEELKKKDDDSTANETDSSILGFLTGVFNTVFTKVTSKMPASCKKLIGVDRTSSKNMKPVSDQLENNNNNKKNPSPPTSLEERLKFEIRSLQESAKLQALTCSRAMILDRVFLLAAEEVNRQINNYFKVNTSHYARHVQYSGFKNPEYFIRNECLFSGLSPVAKSFFLKCPDHQFSQVIDVKTGKLNSELFEFSLHGTRGGIKAAHAIQCEGYDPKRRQGQGCGCGEYQAFSKYENRHDPNLSYCGFSTAIGYGQGNILVNLVYKPPASEVDKKDSIHEKLDPAGYSGAIKFYGPVVEFHGVIVVKNPTERSDGTYMLPLGCIYNVPHMAQQAAAFLHEFEDKKDPMVAIRSRSCECAKNEKLVCEEEVRLLKAQFKEKIDAFKNNNNEAKDVFNGKRIYFTRSLTDGGEIDRIDLPSGKNGNDDDDENEEDEDQNNLNNNSQQQPVQMDIESSYHLLDLLYNNHKNATSTIPEEGVGHVRKNFAQLLHRQYTVVNGTSMIVDLVKMKMKTLGKKKVVHYDLAIW